MQEHIKDKYDEIIMESLHTFFEACFGFDARSLNEKTVKNIEILRLFHIEQIEKIHGGLKYSITHHSVKSPLKDNGLAVDLEICKRMNGINLKIIISQGDLLFEHTETNVVDLEWRVLPYKYSEDGKNFLDLSENVKKIVITYIPFYSSILFKTMKTALRSFFNYSYNGPAISETKLGYNEILSFEEYYNNVFENFRTKIVDCILKADDPEIYSSKYGSSQIILIKNYTKREGNP